MERAYPGETIKAAATVNMRGRIIFNGLLRVPFPPKIHSINPTGQDHKNVYFQCVMSTYPCRPDGCCVSLLRFFNPIWTGDRSLRAAVNHPSVNMQAARKSWRFGGGCLTLGVRAP